MISTIIPVRNEEASVACVVESLAAQPEIAQIIVVDDQSTDQTPLILRQLSGRFAKLQILPTGDLPAGWTGKNYAASIGAAAATGEWLLFTDADTWHAPGSAAKALADSALHDADFLSYSPEQELKTFYERALVPVVYWRLSRIYPFDQVNDPRSSSAAANGQYILMLRRAYESIGGHAAVAGEILEDVALAKRAKRAGYNLYFAPVAGIVKTRMYRSFGAMWEGWTKNLYLVVGGSLREAFCEIESSTPWLAALFGALAAFELFEGRGVDWLVPMIGVVLLLPPWVSYAAWLRRNRYPGEYIRYYLPGAGLYAAALFVSWWKNTHGAVGWKGRTYRRGATVS